MRIKKSNNLKFNILFSVRCTKYEAISVREKQQQIQNMSLTPSVLGIVWFISSVDLSGAISISATDARTCLLLVSSGFSFEKCSHEGALR